MVGKDGKVVSTGGAPTIAATYESVITAVFGALLGLVLGLFFAFVVIQALEGEGIVAAIFPARRASRLDVLRAISYE